MGELVKVRRTRRPMRVCETCGKRKTAVKYVEDSPNCMACLSSAPRICATCGASKPGIQYATYLSIDCRACEQRERWHDPEYRTRASGLRPETSRQRWLDPSYRERQEAGIKRWLDANPYYRDIQWTHDEEELVRALCGREPITEIARRCTALSGVRRTKSATTARAYRLGLSIWHCPSLAEVARMFGVSGTTVYAWMQLGLLRGRKWNPQMHVFDEAELRAFIERAPWQVNPSRMQRGSLKSLAEVIYRKHPWFTMAETCRMLNCAPVTVQKWMRRGKVAHQRRVGAHGGILMFDSDGIEALIQLRAQRDPKQVERGRLGAIARARQLRELKVAA